MIEHLPNWINVLFLATAVVATGFFYFSNSKPLILTLVIIIWSIFQSILAYNGFYQNATATPPRFMVVLIPIIIIMIYSLLPRQINYFLERRNIKISTFLHTIRISAEIILLQLFIHKMIPELMTFEGRNFDILAGITAPIIGFLYLRQWIGKKILLAWNIVGFCLILFILFSGILSAELPFQQFAFDQPNRAITYFPFILLPATIVPIVVWTHLTDIIKLVREMKTTQK